MSAWSRIEGFDWLKVDTSFNDITIELPHLPMTSQWMRFGHSNDVTTDEHVDNASCRHSSLRQTWLIEAYGCQKFRSMEDN